MIELKNVSAGYGKSMVLKDVSAAFEKGRLTGVIGVNGSGKSTLLKAILAMIPISGGRIMIDGYPLDRMTRIGIARRRPILPRKKRAGHDGGAAGASRQVPAPELPQALYRA